MAERIIYCGSDVIEADLIKKHGLVEYPDGEFVSEESCQICLINCPKNPKGYNKESMMTLNLERYSTYSF